MRRAIRESNINRWAFRRARVLFGDAATWMEEGYLKLVGVVEEGRFRELRAGKTYSAAIIEEERHRAVEAAWERARPTADV